MTPCLSMERSSREEAIDKSMVTGEPMPAEKQAGDKVIGGTVNGTGALVIRAENVGADTVLSRIVKMVAEAQRSRARSSAWPTWWQAGLSQ